MIFRTLFAFLLLPGTVAFIVPPILASFDPWRGQSWTPGLLVMGLGAAVLVGCVRDFYVSGKGTLAPWDPPKRLVIVGFYRFVRNPMYISVLLLVAGWTVYLSSLLLIVYLFLLAVGFHIRVIFNEEPYLESDFGEDWGNYKANVSRWLPRLNPWDKGS